MKKAIFTTLLLVSKLAFASLAGDWIGWGSWKFKGEGDGARCTTMQMQWSENQNEIAIEKGYFDCEVVAMHLDRTAWTKKEGHLFDANQNDVGTYDGSNLLVYMPSPNEKTTIGIEVKREANHYDYKEIWFNAQEKVYVIEGRLFTSGH